MKGVAIDVDGVILKGGKLIEGANDAIQRLVKENIPFIFITNGGGMLENQKAEELSTKLNIPISSEQVLLCHSPFKSLVPQYGNSTILVIGREYCLEVAKTYGFKNPVSTTSFFDYNPSVLPVRKEHHSSSNGNTANKEPASIDAVFIFYDSLDWTLDMQVLSDVLVGIDEKTSKKYQRIPVFASNADIVYATDYPLPRFTQGAFVEAFKYLFQLYHGIPLEVTFFGKPYDIQYRYAEEMLQQQANKLTVKEPVKFYGIGDNPKSDIKGANQAGEHWHSILVRTGLFAGENDHEHRADHVFDSVIEAVGFILD
jgi:HAD superfamily hydrolase (TIGR01456 family)